MKKPILLTLVLVFACVAIVVIAEESKEATFTTSGCALKFSLNQTEEIARFETPNWTQIIPDFGGSVCVIVRATDEQWAAIIEAYPPPKKSSTDSSIWSAGTLVIHGPVKAKK